MRPCDILRLVLITICAHVFAQDRTVGLFPNNPAKTAPGYVLLPPMHNGHTYLIDNNGQVVNSWYGGNTEPGRMAYLLPNGHLLRSVSLPNSGPNTGGGDGGFSGTGIRNHSGLDEVAALIGGEPAEVLYAGPQPEFAGLDQVNLKISRSLAGRGEVPVSLTVAAKSANTVTLNIR